MQSAWQAPEQPFPTLHEIFSWEETVCNDWIQTLSPENEKKLAKMLEENRIKIEQSKHSQKKTNSNNEARSGNTTPEDMSSHSSDVSTKQGPRVYHTFCNLPGTNFYQAPLIIINPRQITQQQKG